MESKPCGTSTIKILFVGDTEKTPILLSFICSANIKTILELKGNNSNLRSEINRNF